MALLSYTHTQSSSCILLINARTHPRGTTEEKFNKISLSKRAVQNIDINTHTQTHRECYKTLCAMKLVKAFICSPCSAGVQPVDVLTELSFKRHLSLCARHCLASFLSLSLTTVFCSLLALVLLDLSCCFSLCHLSFCMGMHLFLSINSLWV